MSVSVAWNKQHTRQMHNPLVLPDNIADILDSLPAAILLLDTQGMVIAQNDTARQWLDADVLYKSWAWILEHFFEVSADQQDLRLPDGRIVTLSTNPLQGSKGQTILLTDVTEQRILQSKQARQGRLSLMGEMLATLAHQVRTPLTSSMLYFSQAMSEKLPWKLKQNFISKGLENLKLLESMIRELLMFSKGGQFHAQWIRLDTALEYCQQQLSPLLANHHSTLKVAQIAPVEVLANHDALASVLINLVENAVVHNQQAVEICISTRSGDGYLAIDIQNNGEAIAEQALASLYTPFFTTRSNGTGLGLSIAKTIIESFGGKILLSNNTHGKVIFTLQLQAKQGAIS